MTLYFGTEHQNAIYNHSSSFLHYLAQCRLHASNKGRLVDTITHRPPRSVSRDRQTIGQTHKQKDIAIV